MFGSLHNNCYNKGGYWTLLIKGHPLNAATSVSPDKRSNKASASDLVDLSLFMGNGFEWGKKTIQIQQPSSPELLILS